MSTITYGPIRQAAIEYRGAWADMWRVDGDDSAAMTRAEDAIRRLERLDTAVTQLLVTARKVAVLLEPPDSEGNPPSARLARELLLAVERVEKATANA